MNYKSGDLVTITGNCNFHRFRIGETVRLEEKEGSDWRSESLKGRKCWWVRESDMKPFKPAIMPQKIVITTDGKTTLARLFDGKTMVKRAEAKCAPSDVFDFGVGAELAMKRMMGAKPAEEPAAESKPEPVRLYCSINGFEPFFTQGKVYEFKSGRIEMDSHKSFLYESIDDFFAHNNSFKSCLVPLVRRPAKVGEWVYIIAATVDKSNKYSNGSILKITSVNKNGLGKTRYGKGTGEFLYGSEYLVLDGYHGEPNEA